MKSTTALIAALMMPRAFTLRALGAAKPPCVYKPVMSAEDIENCR